MSPGKKLIEAVLFDFDGTLTGPGQIDFAAIRQAIGCPAGKAILEYIENLVDDEVRAEAWRVLNSFELEAAVKSHPNEGAEDLLRFLVARRVKIGIISRNSRESILRAFRNFEQFRESDFDVLLSRDDPVTPKPSPDAILEASRRMGVPVSRILVVGDFVYDMTAGREAGAVTAFLTNRNTRAPEPAPDFTVDALHELEGIVDLHIPLRPGKLPNRFLESFLEEMPASHPSLLVAPGVGEDTAAVAWGDEEVLVLKADPVTYTADAAGTIAVLVNMNDVATSGATPRWLMATILLPPGTNAAGARDLMAEIHRTTVDHGLILCGGHTEITDAVLRPVLACQVIGTVPRKGLIEKSSMRPGDRILLTKELAIEGTCILAREVPDILLRRGLSAGELERCRTLLTDPGISIVREAGIAVRSGGVSALHDVTEGGLATALEELSAAGKHRLRVYPDRIPVLHETRRICEILEIDPLGLIGSGSLLIACREQASGAILSALGGAGIRVARIGEVLDPGFGVEAVRQDAGESVPWPHFEVDEIARVFDELFGKPRSA